MDYIKQHPTMPLKDMSTKVYEPLTSLFVNFLNAYRNFIESLETKNNIEYTSSYTAIMKDSQSIQDLEEKIHGVSYFVAC